MVAVAVVIRDDVVGLPDGRIADDRLAALQILEKRNRRQTPFQNDHFGDRRAEDVPGVVEADGGVVVDPLVMPVGAGWKWGIVRRVIAGDSATGCLPFPPSLRCRFRL